MDKNQSVVAGVKRRVTQSAINESVKEKKIQKIMQEILQETSASQVWSLPSANNFINTKTEEVFAKPTELTNDEIVFTPRSGDKYMHSNTLKFHLTVKMQKKDGIVWKNVPDTDIICVKPNAIVDLLRKNLEVRMTHPGDIVDNKVINVKQDEQRYLTRFAVQRGYDRLYCEKELENDMQIAKEWTYSYLHGNNSHVDYRPKKAAAAFGKRQVDKEIIFPDGSILKKCKKFGDELKTGKKFIIHGAVMDPVFQAPLLPPHHGLQVKTKLGRDEDHIHYIEDYTKLAKEAEENIYRFVILKTGANKVFCRYDTSSLTTAALEKYNEQFANNKSVHVAQFMVYQMQHRTIEQNATELQDMEFPNTSDVPTFATLEFKHRDDFNHTSTRANYFDNSFLNQVKQIKFQSASDINPAYRDGVTTIDFNEDIDVTAMQKAQRRFMLGRELVNMSDSLPAYGVLNGSSKELYDNEGESEADFRQLEKERHLTPIVLELDPSHGKYNADQKHTTMSNTEIKMSFTFRNPLPETCVMILTSAYRGKYVQKRMTNGLFTMDFQNVDISSTLL